MAKLSDLHNAIVKGNLELAVSTTQEALQENIDPQTLISDYLIKGMEEIGTQFEAGKAYVPNLLMSARAMKGALELLKPYMENDKNTISLGKVVIGTVKGDLHDIGKNLVSSMLEGCGFEVINLGVDVSDEKFVEAAKEHKANIVCMSALLTTFKSSSPKQVYDETERLLHVTTDFDNFIISTGCDVPPGVSLENINAFYRAVEIFRNRH